MLLNEGDRLHLALRWGGGGARHHPLSPEDSLQATRQAWRRWAAGISYEGPQRELVRRSALTLKLLDHFEICSSSFLLFSISFRSPAEPLSFPGQTWPTLINGHLCFEICSIAAPSRLISSP
jgi:hypothetical protein